MLFSTTLAATAVLAVANGSALMSRANSGQSTFYGGNTDGGMCSLVGYKIPSGVYGVAMSKQNWESSQACGACIEVTGPKGNKIVAMVTDQCPECKLNHLDLYADAFAKLDNPTKGIIQTSWNYVNCPITTPLVIRNKEGTSQWYFNVQVLNPSKRVKSLQFSVNGGSTWTSTQRVEYNYFLYNSGSGTTSVDVKVTSVDGDVVIVKNVKIGSGLKTAASSNFGSKSVTSKLDSESVEAPPIQVKQLAVTEPEAETPAIKDPAVDESTVEQPTIDTPVVQEDTVSPVASELTPTGAMFVETTPASVQPQSTILATMSLTSATGTTSPAAYTPAHTYSTIAAPSSVEVEEPESTVTVYVCTSSETLPASVATITSSPVISSGVASSSVASTGVVPSPTKQPQFTGAASMNAPALGLIVAGGLALFI